MTSQQALALAVFLAGASLALWGLWRLIGPLRGGGVPWPRLEPLTLVPCAALVAAGFFLRVERLDTKTLCHPEIYVPGIPLPAGISEPPPRLGLRETLAWHFHDEPHPPGYYLLMWVWTKIFGWDVWTIRFPSVLFGTASIALVWLLAAGAYGRAAAWTAAALLCLNGHNIYWSQMARMYSMACFLGLVSTWLWLRLRESETRSGWREMAYIAVTLAAAATEIYVWPLLAAQMLVTAAEPSPRSRRALALQAVVLMLGASLWAHAVYRARPSPLGAPEWQFPRDYFGFGFLFRNDLDNFPVSSMPAWVLAVLAAAGVALLSAARNIPQRQAGNGGPLALRGFGSVALGGALITIATAILAFRRGPAMALVALLPVMALLLPRALPFVCSLAPAGLRRLAGASPVVILATVPPLLVFLLSFRVPLLADRLYLLFVPYLLTAIAGGLARLYRRPLPAIATVAFLGWAHFESAAYFRTAPTSLVDYQEAGKRLAAQLRPGDLVLVRRRDYLTTPFFYYLIGTPGAYVTEGSALDARPRARVWVLETDWNPVPAPLTERLTRYRQQSEITAHHARARLFLTAPESPETPGFR